MRRLLVKAATLATAVVVALPSVPVIALPVRDDPTAPAVQRERNIQGAPVAVKPLPPMAMPTSPIEPVMWPTAEKSEVDVRGRAAPAQAGRSPVAVSTQRDVKVAVETLGQDVSAKAGVAGTLLKVTTQPKDPASKGETTSVRLDYSKFGHAYGGDYGSRLAFQRYPSCVLTTPDKAECRVGTPLPTKNDALRMEMSADVPMVDQSGAVIAAAAGTAGSGGNYSATSLAPSGSWSAGDSSGDFTYTAPLTMPTAPGGPAPQLAFGYSAGSLDGRTSATNNQSSWVGDGWELTTGGFIERMYRPCEADKVGSNKPDTLQSGDMCWKDETYTISLGGMSGKLLKDKTTGKLRPEKDDGSRIEKKGDFANGTQGEHWVVTTIDGTQYYLGLNRLPGWVNGNAETNSVLTQPVYGNHKGEPCNKTAFADSSCTQAYRWNVDLVVDPKGNAMSFYYKKETNFYKRGGLHGTNTQYDASSRLDRIEYGLRDNALYAAPPARVVFEADAERCLPSGTITCAPGQLNKDTAANWPDVPFDRICSAGEDCKDRYSPAFFTRKRLTRVVTQSLRQDGSAHDDVDSWQLRQEFPPTGDGMPRSLWLSGIQRTGHVGEGTASVPEIKFSGNPMDNRVDSSNDNLLPITRYRITRIVGEAGALTEVEYEKPECKRVEGFPAPHANTKRCYPVFWSPPGAEDQVLDWFHKYVVKYVVEDARTGGPSLVKTEFRYLDGGAWHYDSNDQEEAKYRTWSEWRGYGRVQAVKGDPSKPQTVTETLFLRGMDGDAQPNGGARDVWVTDGDGGRIEDIDQYAGFVRETLLFSGGRVVSGSVSEPQVIETANDGKDRSVMVLAKATSDRSLREDNSTWRRTRTSTTFNEFGLPTRSETEGDVDVAGDETCSETAYLRNEPKWMLTYTSTVRTIAKPCSAWPGTGDDIVTQVQSAYDEQAPDMAPTKGVVTRSSRWIGGPRLQNVSNLKADMYGRTVESTDADGGVTKIEYVPAIGNPQTVITTNRAGWETKSFLDTARGSALTEIGPNKERADLEYDPLGRLARVWQPGRSKEGKQTPNAEYSYEYRSDAPTVVTTKSLKENETYTQSIDLLDGLLRPRQSQTPSPSKLGGRILTDTFYDSRGNANVQNAAYYNTEAPSTILFGASDNAVPSQTVTEFDDLSRPLETILRKMNVEQWRTKNRYSGDITYTTPPEGDTATAVIKNANGAIVERREYAARSADGLYGPQANFDATKYMYDFKGKLSTVVDALGNKWEYRYDQLGRKNYSSDPDTGVTTYEYNVMDQLVSTKDARGRKLVYDYDDLGRKKAMFEEDATGTRTKLAEWVFDTLRRGLPTSSTRYVGGNAYVQQIDAYDDLNRPTNTSVVIPANEGKLAGTYKYRSQYSAVTGLVQAEDMPEVGGLPKESIKHKYNALDLPDTTHGIDQYVTEHLYSEYGETLRTTLGQSPTKVWTLNTYQEGTRRLQNSLLKTGGDPGVVESDKTYTYDPAGNITKVTQAATKSAETQCFAYDHLRRLTSGWTPKNSDCAAEKSVGALGGTAPYWQDFEYDKLGNRTRQVQHTAAGNTTETYDVPPSGQGSVRPHSLNSVNRTGPNGTSKDEFTYDETGNTKTRKIGGNTQVLDWNAEGRVSKVTEADGKVSEYLYDANGGRLMKKEPNATVLYLPGQEVILGKGATATTAKRYYSHAGGGVAMRASVGGLKWIVGDQNGTDEMAITAENLWIARQYSDPFGNPRGPVSDFWPDDKGLAGAIRDATGLSSMGAREYDSRTGRFASVDPVMDDADGQQINGYAYANNSPVTFNDASGAFNCGPDGVLCGKLKYMYDVPTGTKAQQKKIRDRVNRQYKRERAAIRADFRYKREARHNAQARATRDMGISDAERARLEEEAASKKGFWDVMLEELPDILGDLTGFNDARDCFTKFDLWACAGIIPWGKVLKLVSSAKKIFKAVKKALGWEKRVEEAQASLRRLSGLTEKYAREGAEDLAALRKKEVDEVMAKEPPDSCPIHSFPPGTKVLLADGTAKPIEQVKLDDTVLAADPETGRTEARAVVATWVHDNEPTRTELTIDTDGSAGSETSTIEATDWHPFWVADLKAWIPAADIKIGSWLQTSAGAWVQVTTVRKYTKTGSAHDLTVDGVHTYHVLATTTPVLVHNCGTEAPTDLKPTHEIGGDSSTKKVVRYRNDMKNGEFDWEQSPISIVRHDGNAYVVDGHHRLAAAKLAGLGEVRVRDVTAELSQKGYLGYKDMDDVVASAASFMRNRLNPHKLKK